jgi:hypothetical protein
LPKRTDANQKEIVATYRALGCSVRSTHEIGKGFPDLVVGISGVNALVEVKDGGKVPSKRQLTQDEKKFHEEWRGTIVIIESTEQALDHVYWVRDDILKGVPQ